MAKNFSHKTDVFLPEHIIYGGKNKGSEWVCIGGPNAGRIAVFDGWNLVWTDDPNVDVPEFTVLVWKR